MPQSDVVKSPQRSVVRRFSRQRKRAPSGALKKMASARLRLALSLPSVDEFGDQAENQNDHDPGRKGVQKVPQQQHLRLLMVEISIPCP
jgi:hypothetical protein